MADTSSVLRAPTGASYRLPGRSSSRVHARVTFSLEPACVGEGDEEPRRVLDACFLCRRHLGGDVEVFMYRGDTPFCSEECREEQMVADEVREREKVCRRRQHPRYGPAATKTAPVSARQSLCMHTGSRRQFHSQLRGGE